MLNSSLLEILRAFKPGEVKRFGDMVSSPYFNKKAALIKLYDYIKAYAPEFKSEMLNREAIYKALFPGKEYNYGTMKNLIYDMQKLAEKFLEMQNYERKKFDGGYNLVNELLRRRLDSLFEKNAKALGEELDKLTVNEHYYYRKYILGIDRRIYLLTDSNLFERIDPIKNLNEDLSAYFLINLFQSNASSVIIESHYNTVSEKAFIERLIEAFKDRDVHKNELVQMAYNMYLLALDIENINAYYALKELLIKNMPRLSPEERYGYFVTLFNHAGYRLGNAEMDFVEEEFLFFKQLVDNGILKDCGGYLHQNVYISMVYMAARTRNYEWAETFARKHSPDLTPSIQKNYLEWAYFDINFVRKDFKQALKSLVKIKPLNPIEKPILKMQEIVVHYELGNFDTLDSIIDSSKHFITNDSSLSDAEITKFEKFIKIVSRLALLNGKPDLNGASGELPSLKKLTNEDHTPFKAWLISKIEHLEG
jgi:hypothetical protein